MEHQDMKNARQWLEYMNISEKYNIYIFPSIVSQFVFAPNAMGYSNPNIHHVELIVFITPSQKLLLQTVLN